MQVYALHKTSLMLLSSKFGIENISDSRLEFYKVRLESKSKTKSKSKSKTEKSQKVKVKLN